MFLYLLITLATLTLADPVLNGPSTTDSIIDLMRNAVRDDERRQLEDRVAYSPLPGVVGEETVKTCNKDGKQGECIQVHLCDNNDTIITNGDFLSIQPVIEFKYRETGEIRIAGDAGECNYLEKCCFLRKQEIPTPEIRKGCGWANPDGVGFTIKHSNDGETNFAEFPWTIALYKKSEFTYDVGMPLYQYLGGGSLIHRQVVLTAAHYVTGEEADSFKVIAGEWDSNSKSEPYPCQERTVREAVAHPKFDRSGMNDVSLLFLASPVELAPNVGVACLAPPGARAAAAAPCVATGWGKKRKESEYAEILKRVEVPVVDRAQCQAELRRSALGRHYILDGSFMCAGGSGGDTCRGDGGAPLVCPTSLSNRYIQHGVVSWGIGCHTYPGVYADVAYLRGWIDDTVRSRGFDPSVYTLDTTG